MYAYNPRKKSAQQLENSLVGNDRWDILHAILAEMALTKGECPKQHWMIVGPRGIGKSHLLTLLYHKVKANSELSNLWIPVLFPEELRMARNLPWFLERAVTEIFLEFEKDKAAISHDLVYKIKKIRDLPLQERADYIFSILTWIHQTTGQYILFIVENLQQLLGKKIAVIDQKKLRAYLQSSDAILLVGSATTIFNALHDHSHPFYHFFHIKRLEDLSFEDMKTLIFNIMSDTKQSESSKKIFSQQARLRALYSFTGGNPRMAVFLSDILKTEVPDAILAVMDNVLDELTPYFDAILNDIPPHLEEILNTLAAYEPAQSPKEIAAHLETPQTTMRNYLKQAKESGYIRLAFSKGKSNYYCLNEYLYRIWYQMRDSSHREDTRWLIELLLMVYSPALIMRQKTELDKCVEENGEISFYNKLIVKAADFIDRNSDYCKVIEMCVESAYKDTKSSIQKTKMAKLDKILNFLENEQYDKAIKECKEILKVDPNTEYVYILWGACLRKQKLYDEAIEKFKRVIELNSDYHPAYGIWGDCLRDLGQYNEAEEKYKKAIEFNPKYVYAYRAWGMCLQEQKRYDEAIEKYKKTLEIVPNLEKIYFLWGSCLRKQERYDEEIENYKKVLEKNPNSEQAYLLWGDCLGKQERYDEAIEKFKKVLEKNPNSEQAYGLWGDCLRKQEYYDEAIEKYKKALNINPNSEDSYGLWGACLRKQERYEEAIEKYKRVLEKNPNSEQAYLLWGICLREQERYDEAIEKYKKALDINPNSEDSYGLWGACLRKQERHEEAIEKYKRLLEKNPNSEDSYGLWGACLMKQKRYKEALAIFEKHLSDSKDCLVIYSYGKCFLETARYKEALKQFERIISFHYDFPEVYLSYGQALEKIGNKEDALLSYIKSLRYNFKDFWVALDFQDIYKKFITPLLNLFEHEKYIKQFYSLKEDTKLPRTQLCMFLILLNKYDVISGHIGSLVEENWGEDKEENQDLDILVFTIKLSIWVKLCEGNLYETLRLVDFFFEYIKAFKTTEEKEGEVLNFSLSLFNLQIDRKIQAEDTQKILKKFEDEEGVPFNNILFKVWTCLAEPDSVDAQRYLNEKAIAEVIESLKSTKPKSDSICQSV